MLKSRFRGCNTRNSHSGSLSHLFVGWNGQAHLVFSTALFPNKRTLASIWGFTFSFSGLKDLEYSHFALASWDTSDNELACRKKILNLFILGLYLQSLDFCTYFISHTFAQESMHVISFKNPQTLGRQIFEHFLYIPVIRFSLLLAFFSAYIPV